jgi:hypothetical protein
MRAVIPMRGQATQAEYADPMTRDEAHERAAQLQAEHPERATYHFFVREGGDGNWEVAKVPIPEQLRQGRLTETIAATPNPSPADDPRTGNERRMPGLPGGV